MYAYIKTSLPTIKVNDQNYIKKQNGKFWKIFDLFYSLFPIEKFYTVWIKRIQV